MTAECFNCLFSYTSGEEEIPILDYKDSPTHDTGHMRWKFISYIYLQPGRGGPHAGHTGLVLGSRVNSQGLWKAGPVVLRG